MQRVLKVHPKDNLLVALTDLFKGEIILYNEKKVTLLDDVKAKYKFLTTNLNQGEQILMYGVLVGKAQIDLKAGNRITTNNIKHAANSFEIGEEPKVAWDKPAVSK
jgi:altronate hydrolase